MNRPFSNRTVIRLYSYVVALILVLAVGCAQYDAQAQQAQRQLESVYLRGLGELTDYMTEITNVLAKGVYVGTPTLMTRLSAQLWHDAGAAKNALATLPTAEVDLTAAYRFLSQVGDYAMTLSARTAAGESLCESERSALESMLSYSQDLTDAVYDIEHRVRVGELSLGQEGADAYVHAQDAAEKQGTGGGLFDEAGKTKGYATLIYDGPFSDHLLQRTPRALVDTPEVSVEQALDVARRVSGSATLTLSGEEHSTMPSFTFDGEDIEIGVTKNGGYPTYLTCGRTVTTSNLDPKQAIERGSAFLSEMGFPNMKPTYYESADHICIINFAYVTDGVVCYPDLIKVGVAQDNGQIVFLDARSYLVNHHPRTFGSAALSPEQGRSSLGTALREAVYTARTVIPTTGGGERDCYEYRALGRDGHRLLLYVDVMTGAEEQILILIETERGVLTV